MTLTLPRTAAATRCGKRPGEFCRLHNPAPQGSPATTEDVYARVERAHAAKAARTLLPGELVAKIELESRVHVAATLPHYKHGTWEALWVKAADGTPVFFAKVRVGETQAMNGTVLHAGVYLCDVEVNPAARGKNVPLAAIRELKRHYGVSHVWTGDTYSASGFRMVQRLLDHETATGEALVKFQPHVRPEYINPVPDDYTFVEDWATMKSEYEL